MQSTYDKAHTSSVQFESDRGICPCNHRCHRGTEHFLLHNVLACSSPSQLPSLTQPPAPTPAAAAPTSVTLVGPAWARTSCRWNEAEGTPLYLAPFVQHIVNDNCPFARWDTLCFCVPEVGGRVSERQSHHQKHRMLPAPMSASFYSWISSSRERNWPPQAWMVHRAGLGPASSASQ